MAGIKALRKLQVGHEATAGTEVDATTMLIGTGTIEDAREVVFRQADVGAYSGTGETRTAKYAGKLDFEFEATFEQMPIALSAAVDHITTGIADGGGSGYVYTYEFANTAPKASIGTWSIEGGDNEDVDLMTYSYVPSFSLAGTGGEPIKATINWQGAKVAQSTYTTGITVPTTEVILFSRGVLAIDDSGEVAGATPVSHTFLGMDFKADTGWREVWTADGLADPTFSFLKQVEPNITLDITFEHETNSVTEKQNWRAETWRKLQLKFEGSALTAGTSYSKKTLILNLMGKWIKFDKLDEQDGNDIIHGQFQVKYSDAAGDDLSCTIIVVNAVADITT